VLFLLFKKETGGELMIPNKVKVAGIEYEVIKKSYVEIDNNRNYRGKCDSNLGTIEIAEGMGKDIEEQVFIHELVHACLDQSGYDEHDEDLVSRLGIILHQVLKDNQFYFGKEVTKSKPKEEMTMLY
jgi:hypothetical protein